MLAQNAEHRQQRQTEDGEEIAGSGDLDSAKEFAHELAKELYGHVMNEQSQAPLAPVEGPNGVAGAAENTADPIPWL